MIVNCLLFIVNIGYSQSSISVQTCIKLAMIGYCLKINLPTQSVLLTICILHHCVEVKQDLMLIYTRHFFLSPKWQHSKLSDTLFKWVSTLDWGSRETQILLPR